MRANINIDLIGEEKVFDMAQAKAHGQVTCPTNPGHVFNGNETLTVEVIDASRMDVPASTIGEQNIQLSAGQSFPVSFAFSFDESRAGRGYGGRNITASIKDNNDKLLYTCMVRTDVSDNVDVVVERVRNYEEFISGQWPQAEKSFSFPSPDPRNNPIKISLPRLATTIRTKFKPSQHGHDWNSTASIEEKPFLKHCFASLVSDIDKI